jgi:hypothetical protein
VPVPEFVASGSPPTPPMISEIPPNPHQLLSAWTMRRLLGRLKTDFPEASERELEQAVRQAAALLWPGKKFVALSVLAPTLVRSSFVELLHRECDTPPKHAGGPRSLTEGNRQRCQEA